jgi:membrane AbrB-like protein
MSPDRRTVALRRLAETLLIAGIGGGLAAAAGVPAGWLSGSMLLVAVAAIAGRPMAVPLPLARVFYVAVGILLGSVVTPETLKGIAAWPASIGLLAVAAACMIAATTTYLRFVHGWDPVSALFGASPGSLAQVMALSAEYGADVRGIAVVQTVRVLLLTVGLPAGLAVVGLAGSPAPAVPSGTSAAPLSELAALVAASTVAGALMVRLRLPGGLLFGAMMASAALHGSGLIHAVLPSWIVIAAVVGVGAVAGARFTDTSPRLLLSYLGAALGSFTVSVAIAACFVLLVTSMLSVRMADAMIAFSPGAQDTMMVLALALRLDPVFVGAHHLSRFMFVSLSIPIIAGRLGRRPAKLPDAGREGRARPRPITED